MIQPTVLKAVRGCSSHRSRTLGDRVRGRIEGWKWRFRLHPTWHRILAKAASLRGGRVRYGSTGVSVLVPMLAPLDQAMIFHGIHERAEAELSTRFLDRSAATVEFGGSIGVVSCVVNRLLDEPRDHVVVEANPRLIPILERNREVNGCRFEILSAALGYGAPTVEFGLGHHLCSSVQHGAEETVAVPTTGLRSILDSHGFERINLVVDIEGAEIDLVEQELETLARRVSLIIMETHERLLKDGRTAVMLERLKSAGFVVPPGGFMNDVYVLTNGNLARAADRERA